MTGIIVEGIPGCGKAEALARFRAHPRAAALRSLVVLGEHYTERAIEHRQQRAPERYEQLMYRILAALEPLRVLTVEGDVFEQEPAARLVYLVERFHLTNVLRHADGDPMMLKRVEGMMRFYNPHTLLIVADPGQLEARLRAAAAQRPAAWRAGLWAGGEDWETAARWCAELQEGYLRLAAHCTLPTEVIDVSTVGVEGVVERMVALVS